ncbi:hypothetical protein D3C73_920260 [compost metagenome]
MNLDYGIVCKVFMGLSDRFLNEINEGIEPQKYTQNLHKKYIHRMALIGMGPFVRYN